MERGFTTPTGVDKCTRFVTVPMDAEQLDWIASAITTYRDAALARDERADMDANTDATSAPVG